MFAIASNLFTLPCQSDARYFTCQGKNLAAYGLKLIFIKVFKFTPGREYGAFPHLKKELFTDLSGKPLHEWIKKYKKIWHLQNRHIYKIYK